MVPLHEEAGKIQHYREVKYHTRLILKKQDRFESTDAS